MGLDCRRGHSSIKPEINIACVCIYITTNKIPSSEAALAHC